MIKSESRISEKRRKKEKSKRSKAREVFMGSPVVVTASAGAQLLREIVEGCKIGKYYPYRNPFMVGQSVNRGNERR